MSSLRYAKSGANGAGGTSATSQAVCTATVIHEGWVVPPGYDVDDERPKQNMHAIKVAWKARKADHGIEDEAIFR